MIGDLLSRINRADEIESVDALTRSVQNGTIPAFIGVPMIADLVKKKQAAQNLAAGAQQPTIADQVMQQAQSLRQPIPQQIPPQNPQPPREMVAGIDAAQSNLPTQNMADGGIVAFAGEDGSLVDDEYDPEDDETNEEYYADMAQKAQLANLIAGADAESDALTQDMLENPGAYANAGVGVKYGTSGGSKGLQDKSFTGKIEHLESRGRSYDNQGNILTSPKGAKGPMQTMPYTLRDPGFGVKPAQDDSVAEMKRVGIDYANAMLRRYGNERDAAMAYNWGPGNVDKYIAGGRKGPVPGETRQYASNFAEGGIVGLAKGGSVPRFYDGVYITDPEGVTRKPNYPLTNPSATNAPQTSRALVPYQTPAAASQGVAEAPPTWFQKYIQPNIGKANRAIGAALTEAPGVGFGVPAVGGLLSVGATNALSNATDEQLEQLQGFGGDTALAAAIIAQGRKNEAAKPPVKEEKKVVEAAKEDASKISNAANTELNQDLKQGASPEDAITKSEQTLFDQMQAAFKKREAALESEKSIDNYLALLQGFLGMLGGTSPYAMVNIGQGASSGISNLLASRKQTGLAERALGRDQMSLLTAQNAINKQASDRALREKLGIAGLDEKWSRDVSRVQGEREKFIQKKIEKNMDLTYRLPAVNKKLSDAAALGKTPDPKDVAEYNRLMSLKDSIEKEAFERMPDPVRPGAGGNFAGYSVTKVK